MKCEELAASRGRVDRMGEEGQGGEGDQGKGREKSEKSRTACCADTSTLEPPMTKTPPLKVLDRTETTYKGCQYHRRTQWISDEIEGFQCEGHTNDR
jgi:hypothetical protein